ncbi:MAG: hypothetical protein EOO45_06360 [Flavobacterium sp.]|nr:MAG: hypothetical protein EOO45_06360 [Flavobacterium sp.]
METGQNAQDKEKQKEESNKAGTEKMAQNDERQAEVRQKDQNNLSTSDEPDNDASALANNTDNANHKDMPKVKEQNKERQKTDKDEDFGVEYL